MVEKFVGETPKFEEKFGTKQELQVCMFLRNIACHKGTLLFTEGLQ